jgi:hypothetical protein
MAMNWKVTVALVAAGVVVGIIIGLVATSLKKLASDEGKLLRALG